MPTPATFRPSLPTTASTRAAVAVVIATSVFVAWIALGVGGAWATLVFDDVGLVVAPVLAGLGCAWAARRGAGRAWGWLAAFNLTWAAGQLVWTWSEVVLHRPAPFPSLADLGFLGALPFGLIGVLAFPAVGGQATSRLRVVTDGLIIAGSLVGAGWSAVLSPIAEHSSGGVATVLGVAYPAADIVLVIVALTVAVRTPPGHRRAMAYVISGIVAVAIADSAFGALAATGRYSTGQLFDASWALGFLLIGVGAIAAVERRQGTSRPDPRNIAPWLTVGPYLPLLLLLGAAMTEQAISGGMPSAVVFIAGAVGVLVVARQLLVFIENGRLSERLRAELERSRLTEAALGDAQRLARLGSWELVGDQLSWSDEHYRILGYEPGAVVAGLPTIFTHLHPDDAGRFAAAIVRTRRTNEPFTLDCRITTVAGEERWITFSTTGALEGGGGSARLHGTIQDVTDRHKAERALRDTASRLVKALAETRQAEAGRLIAERRFQQGFDLSPLGMTMLDLEGGIIRANPAFCAMVGRSPDAVTDASVSGLLHPEDLRILRGARRNLLDGTADAIQIETRFVRPDGSYVWGDTVASVVRGPDAQPTHFFAQIQDVTDRRAAVAEVAWAGRHDALTGLLNRNGLNEAIDAAEGSLALIVLDLNDFVEINDGLGHDVGDRVLVEVGSRLRAESRATDLVARVGGDEFAVLLPGVDDPAVAQRVGRSLLVSLEQSFVIEEVPLHIGATFGVAVSRGNGDAKTLMRRADMAMYRAKATGVPSAVFEASDELGGPARLALAARLRDAIGTDELYVHYQPKIEVETGRVIGVEALARWTAPGRGPISPAEFIPLAEQSGLVVPITRHVLDRALAQCARWRDEGLDLEVSVNLSPRVLKDPGLIEWTAASLAAHGVPGTSLIYEITENSLAEGPRVLQAMAELRGLGVRLAIDDLGTGYSSLMYLKRLPVNELKIDRAFIADLADDPRDQAIVRSIVELGRILGLVVVAEGVEDAETLDVLRAIGCDVAQGYFCRRPASAEELTPWLRDQRTGLPT